MPNPIDRLVPEPTGIAGVRPSRPVTAIAVVILTLVAAVLLVVFGDWRALVAYPAVLLAAAALVEVVVGNPPRQSEPPGFS